MKCILTVLTLSAAWLSACGLPVCFAQNADAGLESFFKKYLDECFQMRPMEATQLGDHRFDDRLDDLRPAARKAWTEHARRTLESLPKQVDYQKLSPAGQIDFEILKHELTKTLWAAENLHPFEQDPRVYNGYISDSVFLLLTQSTLPKEKNVANCIARMKHIPSVLAAARENLRSPIRVATETAIRQNRGAIAFYEKDLFEIAGQTPQIDALRAAARPVVAALTEYQQFLEKDLLPKAGDDWRLGKERFAKKLEMELDAGLSADAVLADAEAEFVRVERDMYVVARQLWSRYFPKRPLPPDDEAGRHAAVAAVLGAVAQEHGKPENLTRDARATVAEIKRFIAENNILRLPEPDRCQIIEMPEFQRGNSTAYMNSAPPLDPKAVGFYAVSPPPKDWDAKRVKSFLEEYNSHMLQILTIHEAYPGHYVQLEYANRNPSLIRRVLGSGVYIEGWAVYTEQMMLDQGYRNGDLALRLTQLKFYLRAVANAILDHKMHCTAMTDDEAMHLLRDRAFQSEGEARLKVIRSKQSSCQLSTYFVGRMAMYRLRQSVQRDLGDRFDLARYHEAVLDLGSVPVKYLPALVRQRLEKTAAAAVAREAPPVAIGSRRELFVDRLLVGDLRGTELRLHAPQLVTPVASPRPNGGYATVLKADDKFQFYYRGDKDPKVTWKTHGIEAYHEGEVTLYAESKDAIHWTLPKLGLYSHPSFPAGNIVLMGEFLVNHNFTPFIDTKPGVPAAEKYKALGGLAYQPHQKEVRDKRGPGGLMAFVSPDGIHWKKLRAEAVVPEEWGKYFDSQNYAFWSESEQCYVCYFRRFIGGLRGIARTTSKDFLHWTAPVELPVNLPGEHLYTSGTQPYFRAPHIYVATPTRFMANRGSATDILFMSTRGGNTFDRTFTESFIRPGPGPGGWANRANYAAIGMHQTGPAEMSLFLSGGRRYTLRLDGFVSVHAPLEGGEFVTRPLTFAGKQLEINYATSAAGQVRVELQDAAGRPLPGFALDDCEPIWGDDVARVVKWKGGDGLGAHAGKPVRLRFEMSDADLYSIRFL